MAIVVFAMNGQGLGHLVRTSVVSSALASVGEHPVIFSGGEYRPAGLEQFPVRMVPQLWGAPEEVRRRVSAEVHSLAAISLPSIVIEDTHPPPIELPPTVRRVLLVRPTSFDYLVRVNETYADRYSAFLVCDSPDSPTWPYDEDQTRQLSGWKKWSILGPVYRTASDDAVQRVRARLNIPYNQDVCVFSMGGGGAKTIDQKGEDFILFLRLAMQVAEVIRGSNGPARLLFVKGPYFPRRIPIPRQFEIIPDEHEMPALLKIARGAVVRAGFNTPWECIAAGTPFLPLIGSTYAEPVHERVDRMKSLGLVAPDIESFWREGRWRDEYRLTAAAISAKHPGTPEPHELRRLIRGPERRPSTRMPKPRSIRATGEENRVPLTIRIDDAVCEEPALCWLLDLLASRGLHATLEVVPYLMQFDQKLLDRYDPDRKLFDVSQHGYSHLPHTADDGRRYEFSPDSAAPTIEEAAWVAQGKQRIEATFPNRFNSGFSPPFDALPAWLPAAWHSLGGSFISCLHANSISGSPVPVRRAGVDLWDWSADRPLTPERMRFKLAAQYRLDGHAGIVLHPRCIRQRSTKLQLQALLARIAKSTVTVSLRGLALGRIESQALLPRDTFWTAFREKA